jgi:hypothetical protein
MTPRFWMHCKADASCKAATQIERGEKDWLELRRDAQSANS